jgi:hypothetical protein
MVIENIRDMFLLKRKANAKVPPWRRGTGVIEI